MSHPILSYIEQKCQEVFAIIKFKRRPRMFVKLNFRELCDSKLSGLHPFDNMALIH